MDTIKGSQLTIKSTDLRIGNWIEYEPFDGLGFEIIQVQELPFNEGSNQKPIPLTEEWLVRAGFEKAIDSNLWVNDSYYQLTFNSQIGASLYEDEYWIKSNIIYLHSLQNLYFALTGEELNFANVK